ncbi:hypothetical protein Y032_0948g3169 [Ancylostoma ceylanicum]|uniref:Uncharacterized protein n=1 Tax=Ancylostoma ceylanicum TaxID=53326 RepID=A0A016W831_9BILA|nr:hypothetical protein Y032_0948g3169 [Ancylostoma ceylanicum]
MGTPRKQREANQQVATDESEDEAIIAEDESKYPEEEGSSSSQQTRHQEDEQPLGRIERLLDGLHGKVETVTYDVSDLRACINYCL